MRAALTHLRRNAFTLVETVLVVTVLALVVPPTVMMLDQRAADRTDAIQALRASTLAQTVMEHVLADTCSNAPGMGYGAFSNANVYLNTPVTGLYDRLDSVLTFYENTGLDVVVAISAPVSATGLATGNASEDLFRIVTVTVSSTNTRGRPVNVAVSAMVTQL